MRATFKNNKKLVIRNLDKEERAAIDTFIGNFQKYKINIVELFDTDYELDGLSFDITDQKRKEIHYVVPLVQVLVPDTNLIVDLEIDEATSIELINDYTDYITTSLEDKKVKVYAKSIEEFYGTSKSYTIYAVLNKEGCDQTTVPINIIVIYQEEVPYDYENLQNLPKINDVTVIGNKKPEQYGLQEEIGSISNQDIDDIINGIF
jgi:hypothetical protein